MEQGAPGALQGHAEAAAPRWVQWHRMPSPAPPCRPPARPPADVEWLLPLAVILRDLHRHFKLRPKEGLPSPLNYEDAFKQEMIAVAQRGAFPGRAPQPTLTLGTAVGTAATATAADTRSLGRRGGAPRHIPGLGGRLAGAASHGQPGVRRDTHPAAAHVASPGAWRQPPGPGSALRRPHWAGSRCSAADCRRGEQRAERRAGGQARKERVALHVEPARWPLSGDVLIGCGYSTEPPPLGYTLKPP